MRSVPHFDTQPPGAATSRTIQHQGPTAIVTSLTALAWECLIQPIQQREALPCRATGGEGAKAGLGVELAGEIQLYAGDPAGDLQALPELRAGSALDAGTLEGAAEVPGEGTGPSLTASSRRNKISYV